MKKNNDFTWHVDELLDYDWLFAPEDEKEKTDIFPVKEDFTKAGELLKASPELLEAVDDAIRYMADEIIGAFKKDLRDLHKMLNSDAG